MAFNVANTVEIERPIIYFNKNEGYSITLQNCTLFQGDNAYGDLVGELTFNMPTNSFTSVFKTGFSDESSVTIGTTAKGYKIAFIPVGRYGNTILLALETTFGVFTAKWKKDPNNLMIIAESISKDPYIPPQIIDWLKEYGYIE